MGEHLRLLPGALQSHGVVSTPEGLPGVPKKELSQGRGDGRGAWGCQGSVPSGRRNRQCRLVQEGKDCQQGQRLRHHYMLCGALLRVWGRVAAVMADVTNSSHLQIVRLKTKDKKKQVGERVLLAQDGGF